MSVAARLKECLDNNNVDYAVLNHRQVYTAQDVAAAAHVPGKELAKSVVLKIDDEFVLGVLPAPRKVDTDQLQRKLEAREVRMAHEFEFAELFPGCEVGAMPPFGNLYGVKVYVDRSLTLDEDIVFNAGTHAEAVRMKYKDFERLVKPTIADFARANS